MSDTNLLARFVASFGKFDDMSELKELNPIAWELRTTEPDEFGWIEWRPRKQLSERLQLDPLCSRLAARFPPLYEELILSYRWAEVDLGTFRLLPNPPGEDLSGLLTEIERDPAIIQNLLPAGYIQFGKGPDVDHDPVCFDIKAHKQQRLQDREIDHEQILCNDRVKVVSVLAPSFRVLVEETIERADSIET